MGRFAPTPVLLQLWRVMTPAELEGPDDRFRPLGRDVLWLRRGRLSDAEIGTRALESVLGPLQTMRTVGTVRGIVEKHGP